MNRDQVKPNVIIRGPVFPELVQILVVVPMGESIKIIGRGLSSNKVHEAVLDDDQMAILECQPEKEPFDGDPQKFRLGIEALRLGWAYEYDPYFSLSIARVDPLPHQLEAVYDYFLRLPRIRFLLADDPGAGKTIMAGLRRITSSTLEGLAKKELNLSAIVGKSAEAREGRLVPEVIEDFFLTAGPLSGVHPKELFKGKHLYKIGKVPKNLWPLGERLEPRFGSLGRDYKQIAFDKKRLTDDPTLEWVTPGHPLFEVIREDMLLQTQTDLLRGAVFYDLHRTEPARLDILSASVKDGFGNILHRRLFVMACDMKGVIFVRQPTLFLDLIPAGSEDRRPATLLRGPPEDKGLPDRPRIEQTLHEQALKAFQQEMSEQREKEIKIISKHLEISLNELIDRQNHRMAELHAMKEAGDTTPQLLGHIKQTEDRIDELNARLEARREGLDKERICTISDIKFHGRAWVLPHPERTSSGLASMVRDEEVEKTAIQAVMAYERTRGWEVESVETQNRGFDLISRRPLPCGNPQGSVSGGPNPEDPKTALDIRFIEVKGRAGVGDIALTANEYKTADRLKKDYWLYVVYKCGKQPEIHPIQNPIELGWDAIVKVEHYRLSAKTFFNAEKK